MSEENQIDIPASFIALYVDPGRIKPNASRLVISQAYEFCEALASLLVERATTLQWQLGITEQDVLERLQAGLEGPMPLYLYSKRNGSCDDWSSCSNGSDLIGVNDYV